MDTPNTNEPEDAPEETHVMDEPCPKCGNTAFAQVLGTDRWQCTKCGFVTE